MLVSLVELGLNTVDWCQLLQRRKKWAEGADYFSNFLFQENKLVVLVLCMAVFYLFTKISHICFLGLLFFAATSELTFPPFSRNLMSCAQNHKRRNREREKERRRKWRKEGRKEGGRKERGRDRMRGEKRSRKIDKVEKIKGPSAIYSTKESNNGFPVCMVFTYYVLYSNRLCSFCSAIFGTCHAFWTINQHPWYMSKQCLCLFLAFSSWSDASSDFNLQHKICISNPIPLSRKIVENMQLAIIVLMLSWRSEEPP